MITESSLVGLKTAGSIAAVFSLFAAMAAAQDSPTTRGTGKPLDSKVVAAVERALAGE
jgi:hypothetical protein